MENKFINRYHTFCKSLKNLEKSRHADPSADFVLEGTVLNFNLTFDISWKVMKDILTKKTGNSGLCNRLSTGNIATKFYKSYYHRRQMAPNAACPQSACT